MLFNYLNEARPRWKKFIHCYSIFNFLTLFLLLFPLLGFGQNPEDIRITQIEQKLLVLSTVDVPGLNEIANFSVSNTPIQEFVRGLAETHSLNISIDPAIDAKVTNNFTNAKVLNLIVFLCREYRLDVRIAGSIISFYRYVLPAEVKLAPVYKDLRIKYDNGKDLLSVDLLNDSLSSFAKQVTQLSKKNVVVAPGLSSRLLSGYLESIPFEVALDKIAFANNLKFFKTKDNMFLLQPNADSENSMGSSASQSSRFGTQSKSATPSGMSIEITGQGSNRFIDVDAVNTPIAQLIHEVSEKLGVNYVLFSEPQGSTTTRIKHVDYDAFLKFLLQGTTHTFKPSDGIYLIGDRALEGFRATKVMRLQFRPVDKLDESIPTELKKGVEIKLFKELNSIILSGSAPQIAELSEFIKAIDQPVVNVLIEVIVVELRRGRSIKTGISAALGDSLVKTTGQIFPGLDATISSSGINNFLDKLNINGFINLGKVVPNFYVTLQALEGIDFLNVKSTPKLSALNGHEANLKIGQSTYYLEQTQNINGGVNPITTVSQQFRQVNADLNIKINPMVSGDENITLSIDAEFSDFIPATIKNAPPGNSTRKFTSMIRVKNEEMIVLGGLEEARKVKSSSGVPILSRIPILKWLFSSRSEEKRESKLIIFIKPTLLY